MTKKESIYNEDVDLYDLIYYDKDYKTEVDRLRNIISEFSPKAHTLLDIPCGTGSHLVFLREYYECQGADKSEAMLHKAKIKLGFNIPLHQTPMEDLQLEDTFDIITCLFTSINYLESKEELLSTLRKWLVHLNSGGLLLIQTNFLTETYEHSRHFMSSYKDDHLKITRSFTTTFKDSKPVLEFHWTICREGLPVETFDEEHTLTLFSKQDFKNVAQELGMEYYEKKKGLFILQKRNDSKDKK